MGSTSAIKLAIDLVLVPSRVRHVRSEPLPRDVLTLLRVASGDEAVETAAAVAVGRPRELVREACAFFIEQILLCPDADAYRVLGADRSASAPDLRRNMALLLKWLHPDIDRKGNRSMFAARVTTAWDNLKTPERRATYETTRPPQEATRLARSPVRKNTASTHPQQLPSRHSRHSFGARPGSLKQPRIGLLRRAVRLFLGYHF